MSSSSSSGSYNDDLIAKRRQLLAEKKKLQKDVNQSRQVIERYEHDLQVAKTVSALSDMTLVGKTKNLATLFGGMLKSDEELVEKIQSMIQQAEEDEALAEQLKLEISNINNDRVHDDEKIDDTKQILKHQKGIVTQKEAEKKNILETLSQLEKKIANCQSEKDDFMNKVAPLARMINSKTTDHDFFSKLQSKVSRIDPKTEAMLRELADIAGVQTPDFDNLNIKTFLDAVAYKYGKLTRQASEKHKLVDSVMAKLDGVNSQINEKRKKLKHLTKAIEKIHSDTAAQEQLEQEAIKVNRQEKDRAIRALKNREMDELNHAVAETGHRPKEDKPPEAIGLAMIQLLEKKAALLLKARKDREQRRVNSAKSLERGISAIEGATHAISKANRRLIHEFRDPLVV